MLSGRLYVADKYYNPVYCCKLCQYVFDRRCYPICSIFLLNIQTKSFDLDGTLISGNIFQPQ